MDHMPDYTHSVRDYFMAGTPEVYSKNIEILAIDQPPTAIYYIAEGFVHIYSLNVRGEHYTHILYGPGEIFPLPWITTKQRTNVVYAALTDTKIYCVDKVKLDKDLQTTVDLTYGMMQQAVEQYRVYTSRVDNLEYKYASERLAYRLILLANRFGERSDECITILPPLTHQLLATSLNLSRESVSREMEKLTRRGLVRYNEARQITIPDVHQLSKQLRVPMHQGLSSRLTDPA